MKLQAFHNHRTLASDVLIFVVIYLFYLFCFLYIYGGAAKIVPEEITPLVPAVPGEKAVDDQTCYILQTVLKFMVVQVRKQLYHEILHNPLSAGSWSVCSNHKS